MKNKKRTTLYKLAWASHLSREYGAPDLPIPKFADPLHPQFYNNQQFMDAEEVLNEFLVFPTEPEYLHTHFCQISTHNRVQPVLKIKQKEKYEINLAKREYLKEEMRTPGMRTSFWSDKKPQHV